MPTTNKRTACAHTLARGDVVILYLHDLLRRRCGVQFQFIVVSVTDTVVASPFNFRSSRRRRVLTHTLNRSHSRVRFAHISSLFSLISISSIRSFVRSLCDRRSYEIVCWWIVRVCCVAVCSLLFALIISWCVAMYYVCTLSMCCDLHLTLNLIYLDVFASLLFWFRWCDPSGWKNILRMMSPTWILSNWTTPRLPFLLVLLWFIGSNNCESCSGKLPNWMHSNESISNRSPIANGRLATGSALGHTSCIRASFVVLTQNSYNWSRRRTTVDIAIASPAHKCNGNKKQKCFSSFCFCFFLFRYFSYFTRFAARLFRVSFRFDWVSWGFGKCATKLFIFYLFKFALRAGCLSQTWLRFHCCCCLSVVPPLIRSHRIADSIFIRKWNWCGCVCVRVSEFERPYVSMTITMIANNLHL